MGAEMPHAGKRKSIRGTSQCDIPRHQAQSLHARTRRGTRDRSHVRATLSLGARQILTTIPIFGIFCYARFAPSPPGVREKSTRERFDVPMKVHVLLRTGV